MTLAVQISGIAGAPWDQWRSHWSSATVYVKNDAVEHNGSTYVAKSTNSNVPPASNPAIWDKAVSGPVVSKYNGATPAIVAGVLTLDCAAYTAFKVTLDQNVTSIVFQNPPLSTESQRVTVYYKQDDTGGRTVEAPPGAEAPDGNPPVVNPTAGARSLVIYDLFDDSIFATLVHNNYRPIP